MAEITVDDFRRIRAALGAQAEDDIAWASSCNPPASAEAFAVEVIFVICNSGMKNTVAKRVFDRCIVALRDGKPVADVFKHVGKAAAIEDVWRRRQSWYEFAQAHAFEPDAMETLPWVGKITKYHVAKSFGANVAKPDVHLQRLADREGCTPQALCERLSAETGLCVNAVDTVLWRACANGIVNSRTGETSVIRSAPRGPSGESTHSNQPVAETATTHEPLVQESHDA